MLLSIKAQPSYLFCSV